MADKSKKLGLAVIAVPIVIAILILGGIVWYTQSAFGAIEAQANVPVSGPISFNFSVTASGISTYDNAQYLAPYAITKYASRNATYLYIFLDLYSRNPLPNIYYLNTTNYCYQCYSDSALFANVSAALKRFGLITKASTLSYINPNQLSKVPHNSIVIVPSGLLPVYMLPNSVFTLNGSTGILDLLNSSDTVFYIGTNFSRSSGPGGVIFSNSNLTVSQLNSAGLVTLPFLNRNASSVVSYFSKPTFRLGAGDYYGYASYVNTFNGSVVSFSNTQKSGWANTSAIAFDIAKTISTRVWLSPSAEGIYQLGLPSSGTIGIQGLNTTVAYNRSTAGKTLNSSYGLVTAIVYNATDYIERDIPIRIPFISNGTLSMQPYLGQTQSVPIGVEINVNSIKPQLVVPHIDLYTRNLTFVAGIPIPFFNTTSNIDIIKYYTFQLPSGTYIAVLKNFYNKYYSSAIFNVTNVVLTPVSLNFRNGTFSFLVRSNNIAITNASYSIDINGAYKESGNITNGLITYSLPKGTVIGYGSETFNLVMFGTRYSYTTTNIQQVLNIPTIYIEFVIVGLAIIILNLIVKPPNRDEYYIDVPEFHEAKKFNVKISRSEILGVFDKVNFAYHWKYMPLTLEELKSGIGGNIRYNNIPVAITIQNAAMIMNKLALDGEIVTSGGYYAPKRWTTDSGYDIEYLSIFRRIRDYSVGHAILFTEIGSSEAADIVLSKGGAQTHVAIYSSISGVKKIDVNSEFKTYIVFADEEKLLAYTDKIYKSYGSEAEMLKIGISYGYIRLVEANALDQIVF
ncbi:MAG: hypothetical protein KGH71_00525 [Candidatus Micrarchaeota archaeon]|nr:hypothetical protein [Candidatus Micrarchaeota archaeon]